MAEEFDLIPPKEVSDTFKVVFDLYSPRAHFIILPRNKHTGTYTKLDQKVRLKIVESAWSIVSGYKLQKSAVLSLHFGSWSTSKNKFHAHICVDVDDYLAIYEIHEQKILDFPLSRYISKEWKASKNPEDYAINVRRYPFKTYFKEEVKAIRDYRRSPTGESDSSCPHLPFAFLFHPSEPRVGFAVEKSEEPRSCESKFEALETMFNYAKDQNLTKINAKGGDEGCHLCLVLDRKSHGKSILVNLP